MMTIRLALLAGLLGITVACGSSYSPSSPSDGGDGGSGGGGNGTPVSIVRGAEVLTTTAYAPNPVTIAAGGSVTWTNNDTTSHTSTGDNGSFNSGTLGPGSSFTRTFASAGTFTYHCSIHPNMVGTVTVQ